ncbi:hypothetical protein RhiirB3_447644 [Rhizophagus irregularis]|nr:hypothetical protein RhiirB3_447644 [Rhizophagus irregularis]
MKIEANVPAIFKVPEGLDYANICKICINKYEASTKVPIVATEGKINVVNVADEEIDNSIQKPIIISEDENPKTDYITLVCFNQFQQPRKKIDGALNIPYNLNEVKNFGNIEEEILSRKLPEVWLNSDESVLAFVNSVKCRKSTQLCVYQEIEIKRKQPTYEDNSSKRFRTLETDNTTISALENAKRKIYENAKKCDFHIQGCLQSEDGRHLKLSGEMITMWARSMVAQMPGVNEITPPTHPMFDRSKYRFPTSRRNPQSDRDIDAKGV